MSTNTMEVLDEDEVFLFGKIDNLGVIIWRLTPTEDRVVRIVDLFPRFVGARGFSLLTIVSPACAPVNADVRRAFDDAMRTYRETLLGIATVIQTPGVLGGLSRAIARTLSVVSRAPYPHNVYATVDEAARWLPQITSQHSESTLASDDISSAIAEHYDPSRL